MKTGHDRLERRAARSAKNSRGWEQRSAELVCHKVKSRRPHLIAYREPGDAAAWFTWGLLDDEGNAEFGDGEPVADGLDFAALCRCADEAHEIDGSKLRSALLEPRRHRVPVIDVAGVSRD